MTEKRSGFVPFGKTGTGHYGKTLGKEHMHAVYNKTTFAKVLQEIKTFPFSEKESYFNIGDYGAADGAASMEFMLNLIIYLRSLYGSQIEFKIIYEDQFTNDFNSLFGNISGTLPNVSSYLGELEGVFCFASGIEFRKQCVPSDTMHFIFSTNSVHWLSTTPVNLRNSLYINSESHEERKAFEEQSQKDWVQFLLMRSKELKKGGMLMVTTPTHQINKPGIDYMTNGKLATILTNTWRSFRNRGLISVEEFEKTTYSFYLYSVRDLKKSFEDPDSPCMKAGLRFISAELFVTDSIFYTVWRKKLDEEGVDERVKFARDFLAANWNWSYGTFLAGLSGGRSEAEKHEILDKLYGELERKIRRLNPEVFKGAVKYSFILIRKE